MIARPPALIAHDVMSAGWCPDVGHIDARAVGVFQRKYRPPFVATPRDPHIIMGVSRSTIGT